MTALTAMGFTQKSTLFGDAHDCVARIKKGRSDPALLLLTECGLEYSNQGIILRLGQRMTFRVDKL